MFSPEAIERVASLQPRKTRAGRPSKYNDVVCQAIFMARRKKVSWEQIGEALGVTKSSAQTGYKKWRLRTGRVTKGSTTRKTMAPEVREALTTVFSVDPNVSISKVASLTGVSYDQAWRVRESVVKSNKTENVLTR